MNHSFRLPPTDHAAVDRARFIEADEAILGMEREEDGRRPEVAKWQERNGAEVGSC